jgi:hypothetical protein
MLGISFVGDLYGSMTLKKEIPRTKEHQRQQLSIPNQRSRGRIGEDYRLEKRYFTKSQLLDRQR